MSPPPSSPPASRLPRAFWLLVVGTLINRIGGFVSPFLAIYLTTARGLRVEQAGLIVALVGVGSITSGPLGGFLADHFGRRWALAAATALGGSAMLAVGLAQTVPALALAAMALGCFGDLYRPAVQAIIADIVPSEDRPRAYGILHWAVNLGFASASVVAGRVAEHGFTWLFVGDAVTTFLFGLVVWANVPETHVAHAGGEARRAAGGFLRPYRDGRFLAFVAASLLMATVFLQANVTLPVDMSAHGVAPHVYGDLLAVNGVMIVVLQPFVGAWVRNLPRAYVMAAGALLIGAGFGLTGVAGGSVALYVVSIAVWTLGEIATAPVGPAVVADLAPPALRASY
ncbi:MAG TPA: MFS transporter, partial [Polyangiaceae bacterium]